MEPIRSFIAIELPEPVKAELKQIADRIKSADPTCAKWVDPNSIHLTLKFLGNVDAGKVDSIVDAMKDAALASAPFQLELQGLGAFPNLHRAQVVWVGVSGDIDKLQTFQKNLESNLEKLGFAPEGRVFSPHLTLARVRDYVTPLQRQSLGNLINTQKFTSSQVIPVNSISLMKSQLTRSGAIYTELQVVPLAG
jgi:RNA 2',3'-cyclic 3'-phosphodiesterase